MKLAQIMETQALPVKSQNALDLASVKVDRSAETARSDLRVNGTQKSSGTAVIEERMNLQLRELNAELRHAHDASSTLGVTDKDLQHVDKLLERMRELALRSSDESLSDTDRTTVQQQFADLNDQVKAIEPSIAFNSQSTDSSHEHLETNPLGTYPSGVQSPTENLSAIDVLAPNISAQNSVFTSMSILDEYIERVTNLRGELVSSQDSFESTISSLQKGIASQSGTSNRIVDNADADALASVASEQMRQTPDAAIFLHANVSEKITAQLLA